MFKNCWLESVRLSSTSRIVAVKPVSQAVAVGYYFENSIREKSL